MKPTRYVPVLCAALFPIVFAACANGCKKESDELPPAPTAVPTPVASPPPVAAVVPEEPDAGEDAADDADDADAKKVTGGVGDPTGIKKCCDALTQNMNSAPIEQKGIYGAAAATCKGLISSPQGRQALATVRGMLMGAQMPAACQ